MATNEPMSAAPADLSADPASRSDRALAEAQRLEQEMAKVIHPILARALSPLATYFAAIIGVYYFLETTLGFLVMAPLSAFTAMVLLYAEHRWLAAFRSIRQLEVVGAVVGLLIYANILAFLHFHPEPARLGYFMLLMICVVTVSPTRRIAVAGALISLSSMLIMAYGHGPEIFAQFAMLAIACGFVAFGVVLLMRDAIERAVKARMLAEELRGQAQLQAHHDALTGLPNRRSFFAEMERLLDPSTASPPFRVGILDLDGFKPVNDLYGHAVGDELLREVGRRLEQELAAEHMVARLGGDEFSLLMTRPLSDQDVEALVRRAIEALRRPFRVNGIAISISGSAGISRFPDNGQTVSEIYERADHALYSAKSHSRGDVVVFSERHEAELGNAGLVEQTLRVSDLESELSVVFQPQVDTASGQTVGFESLARWTSHRLGHVPPGLFITAAERCGMIDTVTQILIAKTLDAMASMPPHLRVAINLSARDLVSERSIARIRSLVEESGIDARRIEFEITETAMMSDLERAREALSVLSAMGSRIALDDFGSGYSSFGYIHRLPLNKIKIDRAFVTQLDDGAIGHNIMRAIVDLCRNLDLDCLVEGVETRVQLEAVQAAGARYVQGYYFSRPLVLSDALLHLDTEREARARRVS